MHLNPQSILCLNSTTKNQLTRLEAYVFTDGEWPQLQVDFDGGIYIHPFCKIKQISVNPSAVLPNKRNLDLSGLREIVRRATERGIVLKLVVYPRHALSLEQEYQCGTRQARWDALEQILSVVEAEKSSLTEVWDFEGYHAIGTEPISDAPGVIWQDPEHFNYEFGNIMLDEMFVIKPPSLGERLTSANLKVRETMEIKERAVFLSQHPEFLKQLEGLLPQHSN